MKTSRLRLCVFFLLAFCSFSHIGAQEWLPYDELSFAPSTYFGATASPQIGVDQEGNAIAVWASQEPFGNVVKASHYDSQNKQWSFPKQIGSDPSEEPRLAVASNGNALVVWKKMNNGKACLFFNAFQNDWGLEREIVTLSDDTHPSVAIDDLGNAVIVWQSYSDKSAVIRSVTYRFATSSLSAATNISKAMEGAFVGQPEVAMNGGQAIAVWRYCDGGRSAAPFRIQSSMYQAGTWQQTIDVATSPTAQLILPSVAINANGNAIAIWLQTGMNYYVVTAAIKTLVWEQPTALSGVGFVKEPINPDLGPYLTHVAINEKGTAIAAWTFIDESGELPQYKIQTKTFHNAFWGKNSNLSDSGVSGSAKVGIDALGNAWAVFAHGFAYNSQSFSSIFASKYILSLDVWCVPECLSFELNNFLPSVCSNSKGDFHAIWVADKQLGGTIQASSWSAPPPPPPPPIPMPMPPTNVKGVQLKNDFATHTERNNLITWDPPSGGTTPFVYRIFRDSSHKEMIAEIPAMNKLKFTDPNRKKGKQYTYYIVTVDGDNKESQAMRLIISSR